MAGGSKTELTARVVQLEEFVGAPLTDEVDSLANQCRTLGADLQGIQRGISDRDKELADSMECWNGRLETLGAEVASLALVVRRIDEDVTLLRRALVNGASSSSSNASGSNLKIKIRDPKAFDGVRSAKDLENFIWDMEQYFKAAHVPDEEKVAVTSMYLAGDAKLWWRTRFTDDESAGRIAIGTWDVLKKELRGQFLPQNTAWLARESLKRLKHVGTVRDYVKAFSSLMLDIKNMSEDDKLFNFMSGLKSWAQTELRRQCVKDLPSAIAAAEALVDFETDFEGFPSKTTDGQKKKNKETTTRDGERKEDNFDVGSSQVQTSRNHGGQNKNNSNPRGCFKCGGPHWMKDCPRNEKLGALVVQGSKEEGKCDNYTAGGMGRLAVLQVEEHPPMRTSDSSGGGGLSDP